MRILVPSDLLTLSSVTVSLISLLPLFHNYSTVRMMMKIEIPEYQMILNAIMSEGLDKIDSLSDEALRQLTILVGDK